MAPTAEFTPPANVPAGGWPYSGEVDDEAPYRFSAKAVIGETAGAAVGCGGVAGLYGAAAMLPRFAEVVVGIEAAADWTAARGEGTLAIRDATSGVNAGASVLG